MRTSLFSTHFLFGALVLSTAVLQAQIDRAGLNGTVQDAVGRRLPAARVTVSSLETGLTREAVTSPSGTYDMPELPIGRYMVRVNATGFEEQRFGAIEQVVGSTRTLNVTLRVAGMVQQIEVSGAVSQMDTTSATLGARIERKQVEQLPLNGRNWSTLTALVPGAVDTGGSNQRSIRFAGRGLDDNNFTYDGVDATNIVNQAQQPFVRLALPTESIQEFRIDTMLFTAENGSTPGGQVAVASKSGTNALHGTVFEFLRNDVFDAREPIDALNPHKPPFRLNQFGGSLSGPVRQDRTFFFVTYEGLRQTLGQTLPGFVPTETFRAQLLAQSPSLAQVLAAYPNPMRAISGNTSVGEVIGSGRQLDHEDSGVLRIDHRFRTNDTMYARFNYDSSVNIVPLAQGGSYLSDRTQTESRPANGELEYLHLFSARLLNEAKLGFNRGNVYTTNLSALDLPYSIAVPGLTTLATNQYKIGVGNSFAFIDNATWVKGAHTLKLGAEVRRIQLNQGNTASGAVAFSSMTAFAANRVSSASYAAQLPVNGLRKLQLYSYAQDEWKIAPNLTVNAGLRYSFFDHFHEVLGRAVPFDFGTCGPAGFCGAGSSFGQANLLDVDPRLAVTWAPGRSERTLLRGGFGLYHGDGQEDDQNLPINNEVSRYALSAKTTPTLSFPIDRFLTTTQGIVSPRNMDRVRKDAYVSQWGLSVQQELPGGAVGTFSYVGSQGTYLLRTSYTNLVDPVTGVRPNALFGQVETRGNHNSSSYEGATASVQRTFTRGLLFSLNYTLSHEIDQDAAGGGDSDFPQNPDCFRCERASGDFDARHAVNANAVWELPFGQGRQLLSRPGALRAVLGGWQATTILVARTGLPINVTIDRPSASVATGYTVNQRPNLVRSVSTVPQGGRSIGHWINAAAFSSDIGSGYGDTPRNYLRGPAVWQADLGLGKQIALTENLQLQLRSEFFNIFNRAQYGLPLADVSSAANFGQIISTLNTGPVGTGTPRQMQLAARLQF